MVFCHVFYIPHTGPQRDRTGSHSSIDSMNSDRSTPTSGLDDRLQHLRDLQRASSFDEEDDTADDNDKHDAQQTDESPDKPDQPDVEVAKDIERLPSFHELMGNGTYIVPKRVFNVWLREAMK